MSTDGLIRQLLEAHQQCSAVKTVLRDPERYRIQILVSELCKDEKGAKSLRQHSFRLKESEYFYPASAIKTCAVLGALQKLQRLRQSTGLPFSTTSTMSIYPFPASPPKNLEPIVSVPQPVAAQPSSTPTLAFQVPTAITVPTSPLPSFDQVPKSPIEVSPRSPGRPVTPPPAGAVTTTTIKEEVAKLFLVSDNEAYNRLVSFCGIRDLNLSMWSAGLTSCRLVHRLSESRSTEEHKWSPAVHLSAVNGHAKIPARRCELQADNGRLEHFRVGSAHRANGALVPEPMSFQTKNRISVQDLHSMMIKMFCPELQSGPAFNLAPEEELVEKAMSEYPSEWGYPPEQYQDNYCKPMLGGLCRVFPKKFWRVYNKVGQAYGFTIDNAFVTDADRDRGFFVTAVLYTNENGIINDDRYEYTSIAVPFLETLGEALARHVWNRPQTRAVWVTRFDYKTAQDVEIIMRECADLGLNTVMFQVRGNGTVFYESSMEPWADELGGTNPGWDPLKTALCAAQEHSMELHAWFNVAPAWRGAAEPKNPDQLYHKHPDWLWYDELGNRAPLLESFYVSLNLCLPEVRQYLVGLIDELLSKYPQLHGLHLDYIRFPNEPPVIPSGSNIDFPRDPRTLELYKSSSSKHPDDDLQHWTAWRAEQVTSLLSSFRELVESHNSRRKEKLLLTAAVGPDSKAAYAHHFQDSRTWAKVGLIDAILPMNYTPTLAVFNSRMDLWKPLDWGVPIWMGVGVYLCKEVAVASKQLSSALAVSGNFCIFAYSTLRDLRTDPNKTAESAVAPASVSAAGPLSSVDQEVEATSLLDTLKMFAKLPVV